MNTFYKNKSFFSQIKRPLKNKVSTSATISSFFESSWFLRKTRTKKISNFKVNASKIVSNLDKLISMEYSLDNYHRSNQDTCLVHKPSVFEGQWVQSGDLLADCSASVGGELALGQNILIAYMPWEGYNFEDAILVSERLVYDDLYTSIHIERYEVEIRETKLGVEEITREIPDVPEESIRHLHRSGIAKLGSWVQEGDILVGKVMPVNKKNQSNYQKLLYTILEKPVLPVRDSSLRAPKGIKAKVVGIQIFKNNKHSFVSGRLSKVSDAKKSTTPQNSTTQKKQMQSATKLKSKSKKLRLLTDNLNSTNLKKSFFNSPEFLKVYSQTNIFSRIYNKNRNQIRSFSYNGSSNNPKGIKAEVQHNGVVISNKVTCSNLRDKLYKSKLNTSQGFLTPTTYNPTPKLYKGDIQSESASLKNLAKAKFFKGLDFFKKNYNKNFKQNKQINLKTRKLRARATEKSLLHGVSSVQVYLAEKRRIQVGDKMAGRHGNKGIISQILPPEDMPFLPDGTPLDMVLNPLGVPSRMNVGQIYECLLGLAGKHLGENFKVFPFDEMYGAEASRSFVYSKLYNARIKTGKQWLFNPNSPGKIRLYDGRTGDSFDQAITVGYAYMLRLVHMVDDKIHCLTADHDVLTTKGWVPIDQVTLDHQVATLKPNGRLVYEHPTKIYNYPDYCGEMYHIKNANLDLFVTSNHRMYVRNGRISGASFDGYELLEAKSIKGAHKKYLKNADWNQPDYQFVLPSVCALDKAKARLDYAHLLDGRNLDDNVISGVIPDKVVNMEAWLTFFGLFITEGWAMNNIVNPKKVESDVTITVESDITVDSGAITTPVVKAVYQVQFCQCKERVTAVLMDAVSKLGYNYRIIDDKVTIFNKQLWTYLKPFSPSAPLKSLPDWVWSLSKNQARVLLHAMCLGDGTWCPTSQHYYTSSEKLADDAMRLVLHAGWGANKCLHAEAGTVGGSIYNKGSKVISKHDLWCISVIQSKNNPMVNNADPEEQSVQKEALISNFKGAVHCLSVPNEVFYVRRNGLTVWTGNSRSTGPYSLVTQQPLRGRSKQGGQRLGEMEVWALEGYGAAFTLLEMLTIKSDDMTGRMTLWSNLILNKEISIGTPESFKVLICELQALCLDIGLFRVNSKNNKQDF